jgi:HSP20 family protein
MSIGALIHRHPMRSAASAIIDAERALDEGQHQFRAYPRLRLANEQSFSPRVSAVENELEFLITAELPGVEASDLDVVVEDGVLTIKGKRVLPGAEAEPEGDASDERGHFQRRYRFNTDIDETAVKAVYKNGLLSVTVPKPVAPEPEVRSIPVEVG